MIHLSICGIMYDGIKCPRDRICFLASTYFVKRVGVNRWALNLGFTFLILNLILIFIHLSQYFFFFGGGGLDFGVGFTLLTKLSACPFVDIAQFA